MLGVSFPQPVFLPRSKQEIPLKVFEKLNNGRKKKKQFRDVLGNEEVILLSELHKEMFATVGIFPLGNHLLKSRRNSALKENQREVRWHLILLQKAQSPLGFVQQPCSKH